MNKVTPHNGVLPITHDRSFDFDHRQFWPVKRQLFGTTNKLPGLPATLGRTPVCINDQEISDFCTGFAVSEAIGNQLGIPMSPETQVALEGKIAGAPIFSGIDPKTALSSGFQGAYPKISSPFTFQNNGWLTPAEWQLYPANFFNFVPNGRASYYAINPTSGFDMYDLVKLSLWDAKQDVVPGFTGIICFGQWYESFNNAKPDGIAPELQPNEQPITRHAYGFIDWKTINGTEYIVAQLSQGINFGDNGLLYFSRTNINAAWANMAQNATGLYIYRNQNPSFWTSLSFSILHALGVL